MRKEPFYGETNGPLSPESVDVVLPGKEVVQASEPVGQVREAGRSRLKMLMLAGATLAALLAAAAAAYEGYRYHQESVAEQRVVAQKKAEVRKAEREIEYLREELPRGRKWACHALAWECGMERKTLISALIAMEQWLKDVDAVAAYEKANPKFQPSTFHIVERMEGEKVIAEVRQSAATLRAQLEAQGPLVIEGGRRIFY